MSRCLYQLLVTVARQLRKEHTEGKLHSDVVPEAAIHSHSLLLSVGLAW